MKPKEAAQYILGALIVTCFFGLLVILVFREIPKENSELLYLAVGALLSAFATVTGYFYGSSSGSAAKDKTISEMITKDDKG